MVIELLGDSLHEVFKASNFRFSVKQVCQIGQNMIKAVRSLHNQGILHRDIKPDNFCLEKPGDTFTGDNFKIIDFGVGKQYRIRGRHIF